MNSSVRNNAEVSLRYICKLWFNIVVVAIFEDPTVVNVIKGESVSLNCTISGDYKCRLLSHVSNKLITS